MARGGVIIPLLTEFKPQGIDKAIREFEKLETRTQKVGFALNKAFVPAVAVTGALAAGFVKLSLAGEQAATSNARIAQVAESMGLFGGQVEQVTGRLIDLSEEMARNTGVNQNQIKQAQATLLTFGEVAKSADVVGGSFDRATTAALDLAAAGFGTAETNAVQLGKALNDPIKGITALTRSGVTFTEAEKDRIRVLVESNKIGEAQALVLEAIEKQVGGTAAATANSSDKMAVAFSQLQESIGLALLPAFDKLTGFLSGVFDLIADNQTAFLVVAGAVGVFASAIVAANVAMRTYAAMQTVVKVANAVMGTSFQLTTAKMASFAKGIGAVGLAIGAAVYLYQDYNRAKNRTRDLTESLIPLLQAEGGSFDALAQQQLAALLSNEQYKGAIEALGFTSEQYLRFIKGEHVPGMEFLAEAFGKGARAGQFLADKLGDDSKYRKNITAIVNLNQELNENREALRRAAAETEAAATITLELESAQSDLATQFRYTDDTSRAMADSMAAAENAMARYEEQTRAADDALNTLMDSTLSMFNADLALMNQIDRTADTVEKYAAMMSLGTVTGRELREAQRDVVTEALRQAEAAVKAAEAQADLAGETLNATDRQKIMVTQLSEVARALAPGDPLRRELADYISQLGAVPRDVVTRFTTVREEIVQQSVIAAQQFSPAAIAAASRPRQTRNIGGPVFGLPGTSVPITAHAGEYVLSADVVDAIKRGAPSRGLGRGSGVSAAGGNVINVTVTSADPQAVVQAIRRYNRTNGPAPIRVAS